MAFCLKAEALFKYSYNKYSGGHENVVKIIKNAGGWQLKNMVEKELKCFT